jgi:hypothetical protein
MHPHATRPEHRPPVLLVWWGCDNHGALKRIYADLPLARRKDFIAWLRNRSWVSRRVECSHGS